MAKFDLTNTNSLEAENEPILFAKVARKTIDECGTAFASGCFAGSIYYFGLGFYQAPRGQRVKSAVKLIRDRSTLFAGSIALWSIVFNTSKGVLSLARQKDDKWSATFGGFLTGLIMHMRGNMMHGFYQGIQFGFMFYTMYSIGDWGERKNK